MVQDELDEPFPQDIQKQLWGAISSVFSSWMNARAITYRHLHDIPEDWGTSANVQAMVFGNLDEASAVGVAFTRSQETGEKTLEGSFMPQAHGEDMDSSSTKPLTLARSEGSDLKSMEELMPEIFEEFLSLCKRLENPLYGHDEAWLHHREGQIVDAAGPVRPRAHPRPPFGLLSIWPRKG